MIDVLEAVKLKERLPEYSLRYVTHEFLKDVNLVKGDLKPKQIFEYYDNGNPEMIAEIGKYCVQNSFSTWKLFEKLQIFYSLIELSNVSKVPASYIYTRGQQIKIVSRIYGYCQKNRIIFQNVAYLKKYDTEFLGATVIDPIVGYH